MHRIPIHARTVFSTALVLLAIILLINSRGDPIVLVALLFAVGLAVRVWWLQLKMFALQRRVWRLARGKCPSCGYDLRASENRCPECGSQVYTYPTINP